MSERNFMAMLKAKWTEGKFVCVGLDSEFSKIPKSAHIPDGDFLETEVDVDIGLTIYRFNRAIVEVTHDLVCAYKPNIAFYEAHGAEGFEALQTTIELIHDIAPDVPVILDAKRADIGNTNEGYVKMAFDYLKADAITVHPYLGAEALAPFLNCKDRGIFVLCRTSNPGAGEFQDKVLSTKPFSQPLHQAVARAVAWGKWNKNDNCGLVVGATCPEELAEIRSNVEDMPILIPGIGAQGGDLEKTVLAGQDDNGQGMIINSSRGIIFASNGPDFAEVARRETQKLHDSITQILKRGVE